MKILIVHPDNDGTYTEDQLKSVAEQCDEGDVCVTTDGSVLYNGNADAEVVNI